MSQKTHMESSSIIKEIESKEKLEAKEEVIVYDGLRLDFLEENLYKSKYI